MCKFNSRSYRLNLATYFLCCIIWQENEKTKDVLIEQRFHRTIIGAKGEKIREIRDKYPEVQISFPDAGKKSDIVNLRGPREDVDSVYTLLKKLNSELVRLVGLACVDLTECYDLSKTISVGGFQICLFSQCADCCQFPCGGSNFQTVPQECDWKRWSYYQEGKTNTNFGK